MRRFLPSNLSGQFALVMAAALLVASLVNFVLLLGERQHAALIEQTGAPIARFADVASIVFADPPEELTRGYAGGRLRGPGRYLLMPTTPIDTYALPRDREIEQRLAKALADNDVKTDGVRASVRTMDRPDRIGQILATLGRNNRDDRSGPPDMQDDRRGARFGNRPLNMEPGGPPPNDGPPPQMISTREILLSAQLPDGRWITSLTVAPEVTRGDVFLLAASTFVIFICVLAAALWVAQRLSRPLQDLAAAAAHVGESNEPHQIVSTRAPGDVQKTIDAFNAMSLRVSQLLREKDVMLGALGHDLRTPLSSLRIRIETMEPEAERQKAVRTIEEATDLLEDILELSRQGKSREPVRTMDVSMIVDDMVEDYSETGAPVSVGETQRAVALLRPVLLRRALRNLIDNAVSYGQSARVSVEPSGGRIHIHVDDDGPGMSAEALASATDPFYRGEASRNRETGGAGLGLTLTEAIARAHGGSLVLKNRDGGGFRATLNLPGAKAHAGATSDAQAR